MHPASLVREARWGEAVRTALLLDTKRDADIKYRYFLWGKQEIPDYTAFQEPGEGPARWQSAGCRSKTMEEPRGQLEQADSTPREVPAAVNRRTFLGRAGAAAVAAGALANASAAFGQTASASSSQSGICNKRIRQTYQDRMGAAHQEATIPAAPQTTNGDEERYPDKSGTYTKGVLQAGYGRVDLHAYQTFKTALTTGDPADFEKIIMGGTRTLNGPQGAFARQMEGSDGVQFGNAPCPANQQNLVVVPPPPPVASAAYGTELIELYWGALLHDVAFTDYATSPLADAACKELSAQSAYAGPRDAGGHVTPQLLFRGEFPGETIGPYVSQFFITPTMFGQQPISQQLNTYLPGIEYMTDLGTWFQVQNGIETGLVNQNDPQLRYARNGRDLAAYTHVDVLYQAYFTALLTMFSLGVPQNPGSPYANSKTQNGFGTLGGPDFAASVGSVAAHALDVVWFHKWLVHLRHRPESGGGLVQLIASGQGNAIDAKLNANILNSNALAKTFSKYGTYLLPQAFPEGSPTHPAYPTGHGTVGGACITMLKFFFDGNHVMANPLAPSDDGLSLRAYGGGDAGQITVNGELNKLARNVTFGHGIHAGIHWRSDSEQSMVLGESFALSVLQDRAQCYNEKFTIHITKLDGTVATISNE